MYIVDGFLFEDEATAELAKKEEEGVRFIKERTALNNPEVVFKLYKKLIDQELFVTPVGQRFLVELQNILLCSNYIPRAEVPPIKAVVREIPKEEIERPVEKVTKKIDTKVGGEYKRPFYIALFFAIVFGVSVIGMFLINKLSSNSVNILNYREEILNEYAGWEAELKEKEAELRAREKALEEREAATNAQGGLQDGMETEEFWQDANDSPFLPLDENSVEEEQAAQAEPGTETNEDTTYVIETSDDTTDVVEP